MKKPILLSAVVSLLLGTTIHAQVTAVGNGTVIPYRFVGWDGTGPGGPKDLDIKNDWNRPIKFYTSSIWRATFFSTGGFAINRTPIGTTIPGALLHIGDPFGPPGSAGHRTWMNVGTFCWQATDNMYVGLKDETALFGVDAYDAIINWGDNNTAPNPGGSRDNLRFVFTEPTASGGPGSGTAGLEVMRLLGNGNVGIGNWYVGPPFYIPPQRRLHVYQQVNTPQFRVSYLLDANVGFGKYCDFQTTPNGDMAIFPFDGTQIINSDRPRNVGIQTATPGNTLEINYRGPFFSATSLNGITATSSGFSGLRFTDLTSASTPVSPAPSSNVLSVSSNGDVILVPGGGGLQFGGICGNSNNMLSDFEIPMNSNNFVFTGQGTTGYNVGIGMSAGNCFPFAKLHVDQQSGAIPMVNSTGAIGILSRNTDIDGLAVLALSNGLASGSYTKVAGWFESPSSGGSEQVAILVPWKGGHVFIGHPYPFTSNFLVDVNGSLRATSFTMSDITLKQNVNPIGNSLSIINRLRGVTFEWITPGDSMMTGIHSGFIAQEVDTIIPDVVRTDANGIKSIAYSELIPYVVKAIQEQQDQLLSQQNTIDSLRNQLSSCCSSNARTQNPNQTDVTLSNSESIVLNQNIPNPYAEQTTITYNLPESVQKAQLLFYDATGKLIKSVDLTARGNGQINVFANDLSNGIYSYALVVDGQIADTKRMVKTN